MTSNQPVTVNLSRRRRTVLPSNDEAEKKKIIEAAQAIKEIMFEDKKNDLIAHQQYLEHIHKHESISPLKRGLIDRWNASKTNFEHQPLATGKEIITRPNYLLDDRNGRDSKGELKKYMVANNHRPESYSSIL